MGVEVDVNNRVTSVELARVLHLQMKTLEMDSGMAKLLPPLMVWGAPGLGKSSIVRQVSESMGIGFIDVRLSQREPVDIRGLPVPGPDGVKWLVSSEWPRDPSSRGIILFDEITSSDRSLQVAAYEFILDRRLGDLYQVPDGWYICAAGNRTQDRAVATTMSSALANRFMHVELMEDVEGWVAWARTHKIRPEVIGFIRFRPETLFRQVGENLERGWPSPRSWERVSRMLDVMENEAEPLVRKMVYGLVGNCAGVEFMEFLRQNVMMGDVLDMMTNPRSRVAIPRRADMMYALCSAMAFHLWRGRDLQDEQRRLDGFYRISMELPSDFASMVMMDVMLGGDGELDADHTERLFRHASYHGWVERHGMALKKRIRL